MSNDCYKEKKKNCVCAYACDEMRGCIGVETTLRDRQHELHWERSDDAVGRGIFYYMRGEKRVSLCFSFTHAIEVIFFNSGRELGGRFILILLTTAGSDVS